MSSALPGIVYGFATKQYREGEMAHGKETNSRTGSPGQAGTAVRGADVLFGEVWAREEQLSARDRSMITIAALFSAGLYPQLKSHLILGKEHGITREEAVEIVTHLAFYCGWPKAWSTFPMIAEVWPDEE